MDIQLKRGLLDVCVLAKRKMTKPKFLLALNERLSDLPEADACERLNFYSEMIEDGLLLTKMLWNKYFARKVVA